MLIYGVLFADVDNPRWQRMSSVLSMQNTGKIFLSSRAGRELKLLNASLSCQDPNRVPSQDMILTVMHYKPNEPVMPGMNSC